jgi:NaMN:DMB phosphoribosyltransferase
LEQTILQEEAPRQLAGQVFTSLTAIRFAGGPVGLLLAGVLIELTSVRVVLVLGGSLLMIAAIVGWYMAPLDQSPRSIARES